MQTRKFAEFRGSASPCRPFLAPKGPAFFSAPAAHGHYESFAVALTHGNRSRFQRSMRPGVQPASISVSASSANWSRRRCICFTPASSLRPMALSARPSTVQPPTSVEWLDARILRTSMLKRARRVTCTLQIWIVNIQACPTRMQGNTEFVSSFELLSPLHALDRRPKIGLRTIVMLSHTQQASQPVTRFFSIACHYAGKGTADIKKVLQCPSNRTRDFSPLPAQASHGSMIRRHAKHALKRTSVQYRDLCQTHHAYMVSSGERLVSVSKQMGHTSVATTAHIYAG